MFLVVDTNVRNELGQANQIQGKNREENYTGDKRIIGYFWTFGQWCPVAIGCWMILYVNINVSDYLLVHSNWAVS